MKKKLNQKTINKTILCRGTGIHSGKKVNIKIIPAKEDHGIVFKRTDVKKNNLIRATLENVSSTERSTEISNNNVSINTVEHLLAALYYYGISNILVEVDSYELPIFDGSSLEYCNLINKVGILNQKKERKRITLTKPKTIFSEFSNTYYELVPHNKFRISAELNYDKQILYENFAILNDINKFEKEISNCRTFCMISEIEFLLSKNLINGGNLDNCVVYIDKKIEEKKIELLKKKFKVKTLKKSDNNILNNEPLRFKNESARHKILDLIGDLSLTEMILNFSIKAYMPSHKENIILAKKIKKLHENNLL